MITRTNVYELELEFFLFKSQFELFNVNLDFPI